MVGKRFFGAHVFATLLFSEKKVYRLVDTHEKYTMHPFRPRKVPQERRQLQGLLQF